MKASSDYTLANLMHRKRGRKSMSEVAEQAGISKATWCRVEGGATPSLDVAVKLCRWLDADANAVLGIHPLPAKGVRFYLMIDDTAGEDGRASLKLTHSVFPPMPANMPETLAVRYGAAAVKYLQNPDEEK